MQQVPTWLLILGASARAAAWSAHRAGLRPIAGDLFADADLRRLCPTMRVTDYPRGLVAASRHVNASFPDASLGAPWIYTGGLENHPDVVDRIARYRQLLGNAGDVLRPVRDPWQVAAALERRGLPVPRCEQVTAAVADDGRWLLKRRASAGGIGVRIWQGKLPRNANSADFVLQQRIVGRPCSAVYVAARGRAALLGVTEQFIGADWCGASGFRYCGSLGPLRLSLATLGRFRAIGDCLAREFPMIGLFGVDAILNRRGVWPVEVNPRYTASIEVLERALGMSTVGCHVEACLNGRLPKPSRGGLNATWCGKAILFARRDVTIDQRLAQRMVLRSADVGPTANPSNDCSGDSWPELADVPPAGARIAAHRPVLTVLAAARTRAEVLQRLQAAARRWHRALERESAE